MTRLQTLEDGTATKGYTFYQLRLIERVVLDVMFSSFNVLMFVVIIRRGIIILRLDLKDGVVLLIFFIVWFIPIGETYPSHS